MCDISAWDIVDQACPFTKPVQLNTHVIYRGPDKPDFVASLGVCIRFISFTEICNLPSLHIGLQYGRSLFHVNWALWIFHESTPSVHVSQHPNFPGALGEPKCIACIAWIHMFPTRTIGSLSICMNGMTHLQGTPQNVSVHALSLEGCTGLISIPHCDSNFFL